ncbi:TIM barrel protein [Jannaschia marina]|uniref:TIM barrel protein n=1 Tax=Jannaschia marina TaxID=2741674 RepID=UPI0015C8F773|nr:TIM barrel protein [Jannaschia marina]
MRFALNHMSVARLGYPEMLGVAARTGCIGVEVRNDLGRPVFDDLDPAEAGARARDMGLRLLSVAEVGRVDDWGPARAGAAERLMDLAAAAGAEGVALIPACGGAPVAEDGLDRALDALAPMLRDRGLTGYLEPLGFTACGLRRKAEAVEALARAGAGDVVRLVHDSFHHHLAGETALPVAAIGLVHVSGVTARDPAGALTDAHRGLVDASDRLGTVAQLAALLAGGYDGPISVEAFAPETHAHPDPVAALTQTFDFLRAEVMARAA